MMCSCYGCQMKRWHKRAAIRRKHGMKLPPRPERPADKTFRCPCSRCRNRQRHRIEMEQAGKWPSYQERRAKRRIAKEALGEK